MLRDKYTRNELFNIILDFGLLTIGNYYIGEYTTFVEIGIITWLFWRYIYFCKYDFQINNENINFYNKNTKVAWDNVTKITFSDGNFLPVLSDQLINLGILKMTPYAQITIEYEQDSQKQNIKFLFTAYDNWQEFIEKIMWIIEFKGIAYEKNFKSSRKESYIWGTKKEKEKVSKSSLVLGLALFLLFMIKA